MILEDLNKLRFTQPEHLVYVIEKVQRSAMEYKAKKALVEAWARRTSTTLEPWMLTEKMLGMPKEVA